MPEEIVINVDETEEGADWLVKVRKDNEADKEASDIKKAKKIKDQPGFRFDRQKHRWVRIAQVVGDIRDPEGNSYFAGYKATDKERKDTTDTISRTVEKNRLAPMVKGVQSLGRDAFVKYVNEESPFRLDEYSRSADAVDSFVPAITDSEHGMVILNIDDLVRDEKYHSQFGGMPLERNVEHVVNHEIAHILYYRFRNELRQKWTQVWALDMMINEDYWNKVMPYCLYDPCEGFSEFMAEFSRSKETIKKHAPKIYDFLVQVDDHIDSWAEEAKRLREREVYNG